jgi:hypothetical protein
MEFVLKGDKLKLGINLPNGLDSLDSSAIDRANEDASLNPNYASGRDFSGLRGWESFKYVAERQL